ncbi:F-box protein SKIP23-like [Pistacia vera]|uniref:F-box protein SKIP23-like n=1 Tax=Pistacia vera TaxID=55513 RepID=UPI0012636F77|nr:F-box protein SKIP23-like [Pistacia vera]
MDRRFRNPPTRWPTLPEHFLAVIVSRLHSVDDVLRLRSVCKSFRAIVPSPFQSLVPLLVQRTSFPIGPTPSRRCGHFLLTESTVYAIEPLHEVASSAETTLTWLVKIEESDSGEVRLKDPFNGFRFQKLCNKLPKSVNLLDYRIKEITRAYRLELGTIGKGTSRLYSNKVYQKSTIFVKVAVGTDVDKFAFMAIHRTRRLFVWKHGDEMLTQLDIAPNDFRDLIFHNKKFYALASTGQTLIVDSMSFGVSTVSKLDGLIGRSYLLKSSENLFMVNRDWEIEWEIEPLRWSLKVFKLDEEKHEWVRVVDGLEDTVLFVGDDCSFSVSAKEFAGYEGN